MRYNIWINDVDINVFPKSYSGQTVADIIMEARKQGLNVRITVATPPRPSTWALGGEDLAASDSWRKARLAEREAKDASS